MKIGVFDSGLGGLSILRAMVKVLPQYDYVYLGDSARAPYGNHSHEVIYQYTKEAVQYLFNQDCQLVILACNTASAQALRRLQQEWLPGIDKNKRVLGVVRPIAEAVAKIAKGKHVGVIGTRATISAQAYTKEIRALLGEEAQVTEQACPLLVPLIEENLHTTAAAKMILRKYVRPLKDAMVSVLVNGCTHYELIRRDIVGAMGKRVKVIDSPAIVAESLKDYLARHAELDGVLSRGGTVRFLTTDKDKRFDRMATMFYGSSVMAETVHLS